MCTTRLRAAVWAWNVFFSPNLPVFSLCSTENTCLFIPACSQLWHIYMTLQIHVFSNLLMLSSCHFADRPVGAKHAPGLNSKTCSSIHNPHVPLSSLGKLYIHGSDCLCHSSFRTCQGQRGRGRGQWMVWKFRHSKPFPASQGRPGVRGKSNLRIKESGRASLKVAQNRKEDWVKSRKNWDKTSVTNLDKSQDKNQDKSQAKI